MSQNKQSTKHCPKCGNDKLLLLRTLNKKVCTDCNLTIDWKLDKDQRPLFDGAKR